jgi:hypothetical protein
MLAAGCSQSDHVGGAVDIPEDARTARIRLRYVRKGEDAAFT